MWYPPPPPLFAPSFLLLFLSKILILPHSPPKSPPFPQPLYILRGRRHAVPLEDEVALGIGVTLGIVVTLGIGVTLGTGVKLGTDDDDDETATPQPTVSVSNKVTQPLTQGVEQIYVSVVVGFSFGQHTPGHPTVEVTIAILSERRHSVVVKPEGQGLIVVNVTVGQSGLAKVVITSTVVVVIAFLVRIGQVCCVEDVKLGMGSERMRVLEEGWWV